jgi:hypothetical protein
MHHDTPDINQVLPSELIAAVFDFLPWSTLYSAKQACDQWLAITTALVPPPDSRLPADELALQALANSDVYCLAWIAYFSYQKLLSNSELDKLITQRAQQDLSLESLELFVTLSETTFRGNMVGVCSIIRNILFSHPEWARAPHHPLIARHIKDLSVYTALGERRINDAMEIPSGQINGDVVNHAVRIGSLELVQNFCERAPWVHESDVLEAAVKYRQPEIINYLLNKGVSSWWRAGKWAIKHGDFELFDRFEHDSIITSIHIKIAIKCGQLEFLRRFKKTEVDSDDIDSIIAYAAQLGNNDALATWTTLFPTFLGHDHICVGAIRGNRLGLLTAAINAPFAIINRKRLIQEAAKHTNLPDLQRVLDLIAYDRGHKIPRQVARAKNHVCDRIKLFVDNAFTIHDRLAGDLEVRSLTDLLPSQRHDLRQALAFVQNLQHAGKN